MTSVVVLDGETSSLRLKDVAYSYKRMQHIPTFGGIFSVQWWNVGRN